MRRVINGRRKKRGGKERGREEKKERKIGKEGNTGEKREEKEGEKEERENIQGERGLAKRRNIRFDLNWHLPSRGNNGGGFFFIQQLNVH